MILTQENVQQKLSFILEDGSFKKYNMPRFGYGPAEKYPSLVTV
jgi:hypothetical protein